MSYSLEQRKKAYENLSDDLKELVMSNETSDFIELSFQESGLDEDQINLGESEVLYAMLGLQTLEMAIQNIAKSSGKAVADLSSLKEKLDDKIFSKYPRLVSSPEETSKVSAGNQDSNLPMIEEGEVAHSVPHVESQPVEKVEVKKEEPNSVPVVEEKPKIAGKTAPASDTKEKDLTPRPITTSYQGGKDPYREPLDS